MHCANGNRQQAAVGRSPLMLGARLETSCREHALGDAMVKQTTSCAGGRVRWLAAKQLVEDWEVGQRTQKTSIFQPPVDCRLPKKKKKTHTHTHHMQGRHLAGLCRTTSHANVQCPCHCAARLTPYAPAVPRAALEEATNAVVRATTWECKWHLTPTAGPTHNGYTRSGCSATLSLAAHARRLCKNTCPRPQTKPTEKQTNNTSNSAERWLLSCLCPAWVLSLLGHSRGEVVVPSTQAANWNK